MCCFVWTNTFSVGDVSQTSNAQRVWTLGLGAIVAAEFSPPLKMWKVSLPKHLAHVGYLPSVLLTFV